MNIQNDGIIGYGILLITDCTNTILLNYVDPVNMASSRILHYRVEWSLDYELLFLKDCTPKANHDDQQPDLNPVIAGYKIYGSYFTTAILPDFPTLRAPTTTILNVVMSSCVFFMVLCMFSNNYTTFMKLWCDYVIVVFGPLVQWLVFVFIS